MMASGKEHHDVAKMSHDVNIIKNKSFIENNPKSFNNDIKLVIIMKMNYYLHAHLKIVKRDHNVTRAHIDEYDFQK